MFRHSCIIDVKNKYVSTIHVYLLRFGVGSMSKQQADVHVDGGDEVKDDAVVVLI